MDIIKVIANEQGSQVVSARDLHEFLDSKQEFINWIKNRIKKYGLIENEDYTSFDKFIKRGKGASVAIEYALTLDTAKELAMVEGNAKGREARQYFIACEKKLKEEAKPLSQIDVLIQSAMAIKENQERTARLEKQQEENENRLLQLEAKNQTRPECYTVAGYASLINKPINLALAKIIGIEAKKICKASEWAIDKTHDPRWGKINVYPLEAIRTAFEIVLARKAI